MAKIELTDRGTWPFSTKKHRFVGEALEIIGGTLPDPWRGDEFWHLKMLQADLTVEGTLPRVAEWKQQNAIALLEHYGNHGRREGPLTDEQWQAAIELYGRFLQEKPVAAQRVQAAIERLRALCAEGDLIASLRRSDGEHTQIDAKRWATEAFWQWLESEPAPLFIEASGLQALGGLSVVLGEAPSSPRSDFLQFLIAANSKLAQSIATETADELKYQILDLAKDMGAAVSPTLATTMATILRGSEKAGGKDSSGYKSRRNKG